MRGGLHKQGPDFHAKSIGTSQDSGPLRSKSVIGKPEEGLRPWHKPCSGQSRELLQNTQPQTPNPKPKSLTQNSKPSTQTQIAPPTLPSAFGPSRPMMGRALEISGDRCRCRMNNSRALLVINSSYYSNIHPPKIDLSEYSLRVLVDHEYLISLGWRTFI